jgi:Triosephosphate isomerase
LYGGSVKSSASAAIVDQSDIDGALVGGASLDADELAAIWRSAQPPDGVTEERDYARLGDVIDCTCVL